MATPFDYRFGIDQGRITPSTRSPDPNDNPGPASITTLVAEPFGLEDGETLLVSINGTTQAALFETADFVDITQATAAEVAAVLSLDLGDVTAQAVDGAVVLATIAEGPEASLSIVGGLAQNAIQFQTGLVSGTVGQWSFVLGAETERQEWQFNAGDFVQVAQTADVNDALIMRVRGDAVWRGTSPGYWIFEMGINGTFFSVDSPTLINGPEDFDLNGFAMNLSGLGGSPEVAFRIRAATQAADPIDLTLPAIFVDFLEFDEVANPLEVANHYPPPNATGWPEAIMGSLLFELLNTTADATDLTSTRVAVNDTIVYDAGVFQPGFSGTVTAGVGAAGRDTRFLIDASVLAPFSSEQPITVRIVSETVGGDTIAEEWTFYLADTIAPTVVAAQAQDKDVVRIRFSEPVEWDGTNGALNPANYVLAALSAPAVPAVAEAVSVVLLPDGSSISGTEVDVTTDIELSFGATYQVTVNNVTDLQGNAVNPASNTVDFTSFRPAQPVGRSFQLWDKLSRHDRRRDPEGAPLRKFILTLQDITDLILCDIDRWTEIIDIDLAPENFLDAILRDLGNPFDFVGELSLNDKRKLARILVSIYKQKGTEPGVINAIRFFLNVEVELDIINCRDYWQIGVNFLGVDTLIGPGQGSPLWYSFFVVSPIILTDDQRRKMLAIADYMKPAHEHILGIREPGGTVAPSAFWHIGVDQLGVSTILAG